MDRDALAAQRIEQFAAALKHVLRARLADRPLLASRSLLNEYLRVTMGFDGCESMRVLHLDGAHRLICDDLSVLGGVYGVCVSVRSVLARAVEVGAASIIVVHNHPSGSLEPSGEDREFTRRLQAACRQLELSMADHLIVSAAGVFSFRLEGLMS